ncbi:MAG: FMN-binding protein [Rickettsiales bacterium]|nr:FMN-binding protein [Rickettsiales bacterium]
MKVNSLFKAYIVAGLFFIAPKVTLAEEFLTVDEAKKVLWNSMSMKPVKVELTKEQMKLIKKVSNVRVRNSTMNVWKTADGGWFIVDQVIGKHENMDVAFALTNQGRVKGVEILNYYETYGWEVKNPKWLKQFIGKGHEEHLQLDKQIKNISGATLSCRHITDAVNRITHSWNQILRYL